MPGYRIKWSNTPMPAAAGGNGRLLISYACLAATGDETALTINGTLPVVAIHCCRAQRFNLGGRWSLGARPLACLCMLAAEQFVTHIELMTLVARPVTCWSAGIWGNVGGGIFFGRAEQAAKTGLSLHSNSFQTQLW